MTIADGLLTTAGLPPPEDFARAVKGTLDLIDHGSHAKLFAALSKAQSQMAAASKDSMNPHFKSKYADLAACWDACRKPLTDNQLTVLQPVKADGAEVTVTTILAHSSGEWLSESLTMTAGANTPQAIGSAITYGRRYGLCAMVGIAPEDDDGEQAMILPEKTADPTVRIPAGLDSSSLPAGVVYLTKVAPGQGKAKGFLSHSGQAPKEDGLPIYEIRVYEAAERYCQEGTAVAVTTKQSATGRTYVTNVVDVGKRKMSGPPDDQFPESPF